MDIYDLIEMDQDGIDPAKMICNICHLQDDNKQDVIDALETNKQVYMFYQEPYQSNVDCLEVFKEHLKWRKHTTDQWDIIQGYQQLCYKKKNNIISRNINK